MSESSTSSYSSNSCITYAWQIRVDDDIHYSSESSNSVGSNDERNVAISIGINNDYNDNEVSDDNISLFSHSSVEQSYTYHSRQTLSTSITDAQVHLSEKVIDQDAFKYFSQLKVLRLPDGLGAIGKSACKGCVSLETINIPCTVKEIGSSSFRRCIGLKTLILFPGLEIINYCAFRKCRSLEAITIPNTVTLLGYGSFTYCDSLKTVSISPGLKRIESHTFRACKSLEAITLPHTVTQLGSHSFAGCINLKYVVLSEGLELIKKFAFSNCVLLESVTIPSTTKEISDLAFSHCTALSTVNLQEGIERIGSGVFLSCKSLMTINIPSSVCAFDDYPFGYCDSLERISFCQEVNDIMVNTYFIPWWNCLHYYEDELNYSRYQARQNMFCEQVRTYHYLRYWRILLRFRSMEMLIEQDIIKLLRDIPRTNAFLKQYFFDIHTRMRHYEFIHECFNSLGQGLCQSGITVICDMHPLSFVECMFPLIFPFLFNSDSGNIDEQWSKHPIVAEFLNRFNNGY